MLSACLVCGAVTAGYVETPAGRRGCCHGCQAARLAAQARPEPAYDSLEALRPELRAHLGPWMPPEPPEEDAG